MAAKPDQVLLFENLGKVSHAYEKITQGKGLSPIEQIEITTTLNNSRNQISRINHALLPKSGGDLASELKNIEGALIALAQQNSWANPTKNQAAEINEPTTSQTIFPSPQEPPPPVLTAPSQPSINTSGAVPPSIPPLASGGQIASKVTSSFTKKVPTQSAATSLKSGKLLQNLGFKISQLFRGGGAKIVGSALSGAASGGTTLAINLAISFKKQLQKYAPKLGAVAISAAALSVVMPVALPVAAVTGVAAFAGGGLGAFAGGATIAFGAFTSLLGAGVAAAAAPIAVSAIVLPLLVALIMLIINNSAFMVPPGTALYSDTATAEINCDIEGGSTGCFIFDSSWDKVPNRYEAAACAARYVFSKPNAESLLCSNGPVTIKYRDDGWLRAGGITYPSSRIIEIGPLGTSDLRIAVYTLAHEAGHIISFYNPGVYLLYVLAGARLEGFLPSYPLADLLSVTEDICESISLYVMHPTFQHSAIGNFQTNYPRHYSFADSVF